MYLLRDGYTPPHQRCAGLLILREGTASGTTATLPQTGDIDKNSKSGFPLSSGMPLETIVVTRSTDREFTATRTQDLDRASETWYGSWSAVYHQLREWRMERTSFFRKQQSQKGSGFDALAEWPFRASSLQHRKPDCRKSFLVRHDFLNNLVQPIGELTARRQGTSLGDRFRYVITGPTTLLTLGGLATTYPSGRRIRRDEIQGPISERPLPPNDSHRARSYVGEVCIRPSVGTMSAVDDCVLRENSGLVPLFTSLA
jgi:hypothetical protein